MRARDGGRPPVGVLSVRQRIAILLCLILAATGLAATPAAAHDASIYYDAKWPQGTNLTFFFDDGSGGTPGFPHLESWRFRMDNAMAEWNDTDADADKPRFARATGDGSYRLIGSYSNPCSYSVRAGLFYANISSVGATYTCETSTTIERAGIVFDSGRNWYSGSGTPPSDQYDLYGSAVHELGHATGWGLHFDQHGPSALCDDADTWHTMCSSTQTGWARLRTLATHDIHTWHAAY